MSNGYEEKKHLIWYINASILWVVNQLMSQRNKSAVALEVIWDDAKTNY